MAKSRGRKRLFNLRESEDFLRRARDNLPEDIEDLSDLYRKGARLVLRHGLDFSFDGNNSGIKEVLNELLDRMSRLEEEIKEMKFFLKRLDPASSKEDLRFVEATKILEDLLSNPALREVRTVSELESLYRFDYWRDFTPEVLSLLVRSGKVRVLSGDKLIWLDQSGRT